MKMRETQKRKLTEDRVQKALPFARATHKDVKTSRPFEDNWMKSGNNENALSLMALLRENLNPRCGLTNV